MYGVTAVDMSHDKTDGLALAHSNSTVWLPSLHIRAYLGSVLEGLRSSGLWIGRPIQQTTFLPLLGTV